MVIHHFLVSWHRLSEFFEQQPPMESTNGSQLEVLAKSCIELPCSIKLISKSLVSFNGLLKMFQPLGFDPKP